jgi:hypothetical protein
MTREQYKAKCEMYVEIEDSGAKDLRRFIDKIFNDFESRTCKNCKYFKDDMYCYLMFADFNNKKYFLPKDFGCNKWESKDD